MGKGFIPISRRGIFFIFLAGLLLLSPVVSMAAETVCARVKIEIKHKKLGTVLTK